MIGYKSGNSHIIQRSWFMEKKREVVIGGIVLGSCDICFDYNSLGRIPRQGK
jgi:hypothetical protein